MILGTAGHIDHGKTALVKALTGVDTDRLPEERRRGITIELGFAPLQLPGVGTVGVVDVPGHEGFVRTMLAGAWGVDLALLVIAADEGPMPQTREHLAILDLLGIRVGVIALTKADLVDADWLALVREDVAALTAGTALADATVVPVSAVTGEGLSELRAALGAAAHTVSDRASDDLFRLPVDRVFTMKGTGTVVTGTVWTGSLRPDDTVRILPSARVARVRSLQSHGAAVGMVTAGTRAAIGLSGVEVAEVLRGSTLVSDPSWEPTTVFRADVRTLPNADALGPRRRVRVHLGTREVGGRVVARGGLPSGASATPVRVVLDAPIVARGGDRFVLRSGSPPTTVGGGVVTDPLPGRGRVKLWPEANLSAEQRLARLTNESGLRGLPWSALPVRVGFRPAAAPASAAAIRDASEVIHGVLFSRAAEAQVADSLLARVDDHHARFPLDEGMPLQVVRAELGSASAHPALINETVRRLSKQKSIVVVRGVVKRAGWAPRLTTPQQASLDRIASVLQAAGREPPTINELAAAGVVDRGSGEDATLFRVLERMGVIRQVEQDRYYAVAAIEDLVRALRAGMAPGREYGPAELRNVLGVSRKFLIPLLEYCDRVGVTERRASGRVLRPVAPPLPEPGSA